MITTLHHMNFFLHHAALNLIGISVLAVTLCVVFPLFLLIVIVETASGGAHALRSRWDERRGRHRGAREQERLSFSTPRRGTRRIQR